MKKILLITFLFLITPDAKADMDYTCEMQFSSEISDYIKENCERNNILFYFNVRKQNHLFYISEYCRFDRNIERSETRFTCVLYNNKPRTGIES